MVYSPKMYLDVFYFSIKKIKEKKNDIADALLE